jgi:hypothetical protein
VQGSDRLPGRECGVSGVSRGSSAAGVARHHGVDDRVETRDPVEVSVDELARGDLPGPHQRRQLGRRQQAELFG